MRHSAVLLLLLAAACGPKKANPWADLDYSSVYQKAGQENDSGYKLPSVLNCVDEDLYNCH